ncbi:MAG: hypothetical protein NDI67_09385 [Sulfuritalea sp.]|nr:hypothetical protein [Sulfuritalea sp.]
MPTTLDHLLKQMTAKRRAAIEARADILAMLKDLRQARANRRRGNAAGGIAIGADGTDQQKVIGRTVARSEEYKARKGRRP